MYDANAVLQTLVTKTATFQGTGFDLKTGTPRRGMSARFIISSYASVATAGTVFIPSIEHSSDNTTFNVIATGDPITGATAAATKEAFVPFTTTKRYVRAVMTLSPSSGTPAIAYLAELGIAYP
jgi:hypothetical protein